MNAWIVMRSKSEDFSLHRHSCFTHGVGKLNREAKSQMFERQASELAAMKNAAKTGRTPSASAYTLADEIQTQQLQLKGPTLNNVEPGNGFDA